MTLQRTNTLSAEHIPNLGRWQVRLECMRHNISGTYLALEVIVARKQQSARDRESDRRDAAHRLANL